MAERIQKFLAGRGVASRREIERWVAEGRLAVNGSLATTGQAVTGDDQFQLDGKPLRLKQAVTEHRVIAYHKPEGELVTRHDEEGRATVFEALPRPEAGRWIAIGRLDINTAGLLLLTTDGELAKRLMHPSHEVPREYATRIFGEVDDAMLKRLQKGVKLEDGMARFDRITTRADDADGSRNRWYHCVIKEGRNREVRRLWESQEVTVSRLIRIRFGPIRLERDPRVGKFRELTSGEINRLREAVDMPRQASDTASGQSTGSAAAERRQRPPRKGKPQASRNRSSKQRRR